jgi:hypothetical protein
MMGNGEMEEVEGDRIRSVCIKKLQSAIVEEARDLEQGKRLVSEYETATFGRHPPLINIAANLHKNLYCVTGISSFKDEIPESNESLFSDFQQDLLNRCSTFTGLSNKDTFPQNLLKTMKR